MTPSYGPDLELCADLNHSVLRHCPQDVVHEIVVPSADAPRFRSLAGDRTRVREVGDFLSRSIRQVPGANVWIDLRRPFPPVRGWITQQIVKLAVAARSDTDVVLLADSDIVFVRPVLPQSYVSGDDVVLYRSDDVVGPHMPRHVRWHAVARALLGLPPTRTERLPDYIATPCPWDPAVVRSLLAHVERVAGRPWQRVIGAQLHFSEEILYGVYVDEVLGFRTGSTVTSDMRCGTHWEERALDLEGVRQLLATSPPDHLAVMISAKSGTPVDVRRTALLEWERSAEG
nr:DUF6492 family protein [Geodermatophilus saharensis]